jgi:hypothetical protein
MTSLELNAVLLITGNAVGTANNPNSTASIGVRRSDAMTQAGTGASFANQAIDKASTTTTLGVGTTTIDLTSFTNLQGETAQSFAKVRVLFFEHDAASAASSIVVFNAAADAFQGPVGAGNDLTLAPGERISMESLTAAGWAVDATHKNLAIVVAGGTATLRYFVGGSTT